MSEPIRQTVLDNDVLVVTHAFTDTKVENRDLHPVDIAVGVMTGSRNEVDGNNPRGIAHRLEHHLAYGSKKYPERVRKLIEEDEDVNGTFNLVTSISFTNTQAKVPLNKTDYVLDVIGAMISQPDWQPQYVNKETRPIQMERIRNKLDVHSLENILATYVAYGKHPRLHPVIGSKSGVDAITDKTLEDFHRQNFLGGHTVVAVEGPIQHDHIVDVVRSSFPLPPGQRPPSQPPAYTGGDARYPLNVEEGVHVVVAFKAPIATDFKEAAVSQVAQSIVSKYSGKHSLHNALRDDCEAAYFVGMAGQQTMESGLFTISYTTLPEYVRPTLHAIRDIFAGLAAEVDDKVFNQIREKEETNLKRIRNLDSYSASALAEDAFMHRHRFPPEYVSSLRAQVTKDDVREAARQMAFRNPPTFLAEGNIDNLPSPDEVQEIFSSKRKAGQVRVYAPPFAQTALAS